MSETGDSSIFAVGPSSILKNVHLAALFNQSAHDEWQVEMSFN